MSARIFFHHIHKTAGMSLHAAFVEHYGLEAVSPQIYGLSVPEALRTYADKQVVAGHMVAVAGRAVPREPYSVTVLRDPVERFMSHLFFNLDELGLPAPHDGAGIEWWRDVLDRVDRGEVSARNWQVESLYRYGVERDTIDEGAKLQGALAALEQFNLVGLVEELDDVLSIIAIECGWSERGDMPRANTTARRPKEAQLPDGVAERIRRMNALDAELYRRGKLLYAMARRRALAGAAKGAASAAEARNSARPDATAGPAKIETGSGEVVFTSSALHCAGDEATAFPSGSAVTFTLDMEWREPCADVTVGVRIRDMHGLAVFGGNSYLLGYRLAGGRGDRHRATWRMACDLAPGHYFLDAALHPFTSHDGRCYHYIEPLLEFDVTRVPAVRFEGAFNLRPTLTVRPLSAETAKPIPGMAEAPASPEDRVLTDFRAYIDAGAVPTTLEPGASIESPVIVRNTGASTWPHDMPCAVHLSYHWRAPDGTDVIFDGERTPLPHALAPGASATLAARLIAPPHPGSYVLHWTLVQEGVRWFSESEPESGVQMRVKLAAPDSPATRRRAEGSPAAAPRRASRTSRS